jgi:hypothetical protein
LLQVQASSIPNLAQIVSLIKFSDIHTSSF